MDDLFFISSKIFWHVFRPTTVLSGLLIIGTALLWTRFLKAGRRLIVGVLLTVFVLGVFPVHVWLLTPLEDRFPVLHELPADVDGIVVLAGAHDSPIAASRKKPDAGDGAARLSEAFDLMNRFPEAEVFFTGYSGALMPRGPGAYVHARELFELWGADLERVRFETRARNTYQNGLYTKRLAQPKPGEVWLLVTSAAHIPRSVGVFRRLGWDVVGVPVDFRTMGKYRFRPRKFSVYAVLAFDAAVKEWIGLLAYFLTGRTSALFPAP